MFSLIGTWINGWVNNRKTGDLRRHYDVIAMVDMSSAIHAIVIPAICSPKQGVKTMGQPALTTNTGQGYYLPWTVWQETKGKEQSNVMYSILRESCALSCLVVGHYWPISPKFFRVTWATMWLCDYVRNKTRLDKRIVVPDNKIIATS